MDEIQLIEPSLEFSDDIMKLRSELLAANDADSFAGCGSLRKSSTAEEWIETIHLLNQEETCPENYVPSNTYLAVRCRDQKIVGIIDLRHHINTPILSLWGGHIGYSIRPSERQKGYGKEMLRLNLENCRKRHMKQVMITCVRDNIASEKTILANGGVFDAEVYVDGEYIKRYWITL